MSRPRSKAPTTEAPDPDEWIQGEDFATLVAWHREHWPRFSTADLQSDQERERIRFLRFTVSQGLDFYGEHGEVRASWLRCLRRWTRNEMVRKGYREAVKADEALRKRDSSRSGLGRGVDKPAHVADVLPLFVGEK